MDASTRLCKNCQLISSEFLLSRDFSNYQGFSLARTKAATWSCRQDEQGKRYREIVHHGIGELQEATSGEGCKICAYLIGLLSRFSVNGYFPGVNGQFRIAISETGSMELVAPPECGWGDLRLGWQEVISSDASQCITQVRDGQMRPITNFSNDRHKELYQVAAQVIRPWLEQCDAGHPCRCGGLQHKEHRKSIAASVSAKKTEPPLLPTRVIDVGLGDNHQPRLHVSQPGERATYLTLSYRWGEGNASAMTTAHNLTSRTARIDLADLPNTIRDAVDVTRAIGIPYIWIDAVCIVQATADNPGDFRSEGIKMAAYYGNSYCTIAAAAADNTSQGFLQPRTDGIFADDSCALLPWISQRGRLARVGPGLPHWRGDVREASMYKRAWVLQERALSARILHWGRKALWWECEHQRASEFYPEDPISASMDQNQPYMEPGRWLAAMSSPADIWPDWARLTREYSSMDLGRESDRLIALQGLVDVVSQRFPQEIYLSGMWKSSLAQALCWAVHERRKVEGPDPVVPCVAPSWSWAACPHPVYYLYPPTHARAEVLGYEPKKLEENPGQCALHVRGSLEKAPLKGMEIIRQNDDGTSYNTKDYAFNIRFDSCPARCPDMSVVDLLLMAVRDWGQRGKHATQFLLVTQVEGSESHYRRVGHVMCWKKTLDWKSKKAEDVDIYLV